MAFPGKLSKLILFIDTLKEIHIYPYTHTARSPSRMEAPQEGTFFFFCFVPCCFPTATVGTGYAGEHSRSGLCFSEFKATERWTHQCKHKGQCRINTILQTVESGGVWVLALAPAFLLCNQGSQWPLPKLLLTHP